MWIRLMAGSVYTNHLSRRVCVSAARVGAIKNLNTTFSFNFSKFFKLKLRTKTNNKTYSQIKIIMILNEFDLFLSKTIRISWSKSWKLWPHTRQPAVNCQIRFSRLFPDLLEKLHERIIDHKGYGNIQTNSAQSRHGALVERPWSFVFGDWDCTVQGVLVLGSFEALHSVFEWREVD